MKKRFFIKTLLMISLIANAQTNIIDIHSGLMLHECPIGTYQKDINNTFTPYLGTWKYQNGSEILIIKLEKVTKYYDTESGNYKDYIKGNYSYTTNNGNNYITNTIISNQSNTDPNLNSIYSPGSHKPEYINMGFTDEVRQVRCDAVFTFLPSSTSQVTFKISNRSRGYIYPEVPPSYVISIPNNVVLTKQP